MTLQDAKYSLQIIINVMNNHQKEIDYHQKEIDYYKRMMEGRKSEIAELEQIIKDHENPQNALD